METSKKHSFKKIALIGVGLLLVAGAGGAYFLQHRSARSLSQKNADLSTQQKKLADKNTELSGQNTDLTTALKALQDQLSKQTTKTSQSSSPATITPSILAKMTVTGVGHRIITVPATESHAELNTDFTSVSLSLSNTSTTNQTYDMGQFYTVSSEGIIVKPESFGPALIGEQPWYRTALAPGGHADISILFPAGHILSTIVWAVPSGGTLTASLPAQQ